MNFLSFYLIFAIHSLNKTLENLEKSQSCHSQKFQLAAPRMPLNSPPLCVTLYVQNLCDAERELKIHKQLLCECSMKKNRLRKKGDGVKCPHKDVAEISPAFSRIKSSSIVELEASVKYELLGQQEVQFLIM